MLVQDGEYQLGLCRGRVGEGWKSWEVGKGESSTQPEPKGQNTSARMKESTSGTWQLDRVLLSLHGGPEQPVEPVKSPSITQSTSSSITQSRPTSLGWILGQAVVTA